MTTEEKAAAFDLLATCFTNRWHDGKWSWWCCNPAGGTELPKRATQAEAIADLVEWAKGIALRKGKV